MDSNKQRAGAHDRRPGNRGPIAIPVVRRCPTCGHDALACEALLSTARAEIEQLRAVVVSIDTPNDICDGIETDTLGALMKRYGEQCLAWVVTAGGGDDT